MAAEDEFQRKANQPRRSTTMMMTTLKGYYRVLCVDDHQVARRELCSLLGQEKDIEIVGEASDGHEAIEKTRELKPNVILMDFSMPRMNGIDATRAIHREFPEIRIIGLSMYDEADLAAAMREAGAVSYLSKNGDPDLLIESIREK
jgi:DNA-binding NarL/FixJ family response regulator